VKRIRKQKEFDNLRENGKRFKSKHLDIIVVKPDNYTKLNQDDYGLAVITSKKIGNAVKRNKIRRWIKEWFRQTNYPVKTRLNYLVITKNHIYQSGRDTIIKEIKNALEKIK